jgi:hypothetical protein
MEAAVPLTPPPLPTRVQLLAARKVAANPAAFIQEPDFEALISRAWWQLKTDQLERIASRKAAQTVRSTFPEDAA